MTDISATPDAPAGALQGPAPAAGRRPATRTAGVRGGVLNAFSHGFLLVWAVLVTVPLLWAVLSSTRTSGEILAGPWALPRTLHWENFSRAWTEADLGRFFLNTAIVLAGSLTGTLLLGSMAAYVLARYPFPGNRFLYYLFVSGLTFPVIMALAPLFGTVRVLGLLNTYQGLILVYIGHSLSFTVFFLHGFFRTLPTSLSEAALLDGASHTRTFFQVMLPLARPGLVSVGIFNFVGQWNQYLLPLVLNTDDNKRVLTQGLVNLAQNNDYKGQIAPLFAGLVLAMLPVLAVYALFQRQVQDGLTAGAVK